MNLVFEQPKIHEPQPVWQPLKTKNLKPTDKINLLLSTPDRFRAWLHTNQPSAYVGTVNDREMCPLHNWLVDEGIRNPLVGVSSIQFRLHWYSIKKNMHQCLLGHIDSYI